MLTVLIVAVGEVLFHWAPPNGYLDGMGYGVTTNGLFFRWNIFLVSVEAETRGLRLYLAAMNGDAGMAEQLVDHLAKPAASNVHH